MTDEQRHRLKNILQQYITLTKDIYGNPIIVGFDRAIDEIECTSEG